MPPVGASSRRLGNHGRRLDGRGLCCHLLASRVTLLRVMKFGFGSTPEKNGIPHIDRIVPSAALPGGEITIYGSSFISRRGARPVVRFGEAEAALALASSNRLIARVPENGTAGTIQVVNAQHESQLFPVALAYQIADNLHPVANPAVDAQ